MTAILNFIQQIWTSSIRRQLMLGIILVHVVLMSIFVFDLVERQRNFLQQQSVEQATSLVTTLAANSTLWVLANDVTGLEEILDINYPALRYAMVLSPNGRVLGHTQLNKVGLFVTDTVSTKLLTETKEQIVLVNNTVSIDVASPITSNGVFIGWARINLSQHGISQNLQIITRDGLLYTALVIVVGALFAFFMAEGITHGLQHIVEVAEGIKDGNLALRTHFIRHDELGKLGDDFNVMLDTIGKTRRDLQAIMDNSPAVIYVKDIKGRFTFVNKEFQKILNLTSENIIGKSLSDIFPEEIANEMQRNDQDVLQTGQALESEEKAPHKNGMHTYTSIKFPLYDDNDNIYAVCGISTDITERLKIENEKSALEVQLLHTQKMQAIGQLTGGIAHDFNNLLAVVLGYTELSMDKFAGNNETLGKYLEQIRMAGIRGRELVEQMMLYSRKDQTREETTAIQVGLVLNQTIKMLEATFPTSISIETAIEAGIPKIKSNISLLTQLIMNLCINAKDSMVDEGHLLISLNIEKFTDCTCSSCHEFFTGEYVIVSIKDSGQGIAEDTLHRIFEPFFTTKNVGKGTGMGLSVVHGIVHKLGGHILLSSVIGQGSEFKVLLPILDEQFESNETVKLNKIDYDFSNLTIMVVDDEEAIARFLEESLQRWNAKVEFFTDSLEALEDFKRDPKKYDFVITDQTMPGLTGVALSEYLMLFRPDIKVILCTGYSTEITEESALQMGIKSFMDKPIEIEKLYSIINELK